MIIIGVKRVGCAIGAEIIKIIKKHMVCPKCMIQMSQYNKVGGGSAEENRYQTWTIQTCPQCNRFVKESYECQVISLADLKELEMDEDREIVPIE